MKSKRLHLDIQTLMLSLLYLSESQHPVHTPRNLRQGLCPTVQILDATTVGATSLPDRIQSFAKARAKLETNSLDLKLAVNSFLPNYPPVLYRGTGSRELLDSYEEKLLSSTNRSLLKYCGFSMSARRYNVGIIGYGLSAKVFHIPLILSVPDFKLHAIVQRSPKPGDNAEKDHPRVKVWRSADEMVTDENLDVVVVTTAPDTHLSLAKLALEAGMHGASLNLLWST